MTLQQLHELTGKVLKERPDLASKTIQQLQGCSILAIHQEIPTSDCLHLIPEFDAERVNGGLLWKN